MNDVVFLIAIGTIAALDVTLVALIVSAHVKHARRMERLEREP